MKKTSPEQFVDNLDSKEFVQPNTTASVSNCNIVELPSGKHAEISEGRGRDLRMAAKMTNGTDEFDFMFCLISVLCKVDGRRVLPEDIEDLSLADLTAIQAALFQKTGLGGSQAQGKSQS